MIRPTIPPNICKLGQVAGHYLWGHKAGVDPRSQVNNRVAPPGPARCMCGFCRYTDKGRKVLATAGNCIFVVCTRLVNVPGVGGINS